MTIMIIPVKNRSLPWIKCAVQCYGSNKAREKRRRRALPTCITAVICSVVWSGRAICLEQISRESIQSGPTADDHLPLCLHDDYCMQSTAQHTQTYTSFSCVLHVYACIGNQGILCSWYVLCKYREKRNHYKHNIEFDWHGTNLS